MIFSIAFIFRNCVYKKDDSSKENNNLGKIVFDYNNQAKNSWACLGQTCSRSLIVFPPQLNVILLIIFGCFWRIHPSKTCDASTVWFGVLPSSKLLTSFFLQKIESLLRRSFRNWKITAYLQLAENWNISTKVSQNSVFLSSFPTSLRCYAKVN